MVSFNNTTVVVVDSNLEAYDPYVPPSHLLPKLQTAANITNCYLEILSLATYSLRLGLSRDFKFRSSQAVQIAVNLEGHQAFHVVVDEAAHALTKTGVYATEHSSYSEAQDDGRLVLKSLRFPAPELDRQVERFDKKMGPTTRHCTITVSFHGGRRNDQGEFVPYGDPAIAIYRFSLRTRKQIQALKIKRLVHQPKLIADALSGVVSKRNIPRSKSVTQDHGVADDADKVLAVPPKPHTSSNSEDEDAPIKRKKAPARGSPARPAKRVRSAQTSSSKEEAMAMGQARRKVNEVAKSELGRLSRSQTHDDADMYEGAERPASNANPNTDARTDHGSPEDVSVDASVSLPIRAKPIYRTLVQNRPGSQDQVQPPKEQTERRRKLFETIEQAKQCAPPIDWLKGGIHAYATAAKINEGVSLLDSMKQTLAEYFKAEDAGQVGDEFAASGHMDLSNDFN